MFKPIAIIAGEPNSISSEIIFKSWKLKKRYKHKPLLIIGSIKILNQQKNKLKYNLKIKKIDINFKKKDLQGSTLPVYNVDYSQKKPFEKISKNSQKYIFKCFDIALKMIKELCGNNKSKWDEATLAAKNSMAARIKLSHGILTDIESNQATAP